MRRSLLLLGILATPAFAQEKNLNCNDRDWHNGRARFCEMREQGMASAGRLSVDGMQNGGVTVKGWDRGDVLVRSQVSAQGENDGDARAIASQVIVHASGAAVSADGPSGKSWTVTYEVFVPRRMDLNLKATNGGIHIDGVNGNIEFATQNGGVHLGGVAGLVKGRTQNGGVHVELAGTRWDGQGLDVETQNGGVTLSVPSGFAAHLETSTVNGGVNSDFAELGVQRKQNHVSANIGTGGAPIRLVTVNGGVHIQKRS